MTDSVANLHRNIKTIKAVIVNMAVVAKLSGTSNSIGSLTIIPRARVGYEMVHIQRGA